MVEGNINAAMKILRIWDLPTRLFHWLLALLVLASFVTAETDWPHISLGGRAIAPMTIHIWCGIAILVLVLFRLGWGIIGSSTARFANFVRGPGAMVAYARGLWRKPPMFVAGHNPLGAAMIVVMLAALLLQAVTGLFSKDDDDFYGVAVGPLHERVSEATGHFMTHVHHLNHLVIEVLVYVHIAAAALYWLVLRENLIGAMFTGDRPLPPDHTPAALRFASLRRALALLVVMGTLVWAALKFFPG